MALGYDMKTNRNSIVTLSEFQAHVKNRKEHSGYKGASALPIGTENQTIRRNATKWEATSILETHTDGIYAKATTGDTLLKLRDIDDDYSVFHYKYDTDNAYVIKNEADVDFSDVVLHCHFSTDFTDSSSYDHVESVGDADIDSGVYKFSPGSALFHNPGGVNWDYIKYTDQANEFKLGTSDFGISLQLRFVSKHGLDNFILINGYASTGLGMMYGVKLVGYNTTLWFYSNTGTFHCTWKPSLNTWYNVEFDRNGANAYIFIDGISQVVTIDTPLGNIAAAGDIVIGAGELDLVGYAYYGFDGYIDEVYFKIGSYIHIAAFDPPVTPFPAVSTSGNNEIIRAEKSSDIYTQDLYIGSEGMRIIFLGEIMGSSGESINLRHSELENLGWSVCGHTGTSAEFANTISDETGSGLLVFNNAPTFTAPVLGLATGTSLALGGALATNSILTITDGGSVPTLIANTDFVYVGNTSATGDNCGIIIAAGTTGIAFIGFGDSGNRAAASINYSNYATERLSIYTGGSERINFPSAGGVIINAFSSAGFVKNSAAGLLSGGNALALADIPIMTSAEFATKISNETGTGLMVFNDTPTLVSPALGYATANYLGILLSQNGVTQLRVDNPGTGIYSASGIYVGENISTYSRFMALTYQNDSYNDVSNPLVQPASGQIFLSSLAYNGFKFITTYTTAPIVFVQGGTALANEKMRINTTGAQMYAASIMNFRDTALGIYSQADTFLDIFADGGIRIGDSSGGAPTNYINFASNGNISFVGTSGFYPRRIRQDEPPAAGTGATQIDSGEMLFWCDSNDSDTTYLVYNDATKGIIKIALT